MHKRTASSITIGECARWNHIHVIGTRIHSVGSVFVAIISDRMTRDVIHCQLQSHDTSIQSNVVTRR